MRHPPTGTVTFLFTDIEGSARLWEQSAEAMRLALARHDQILRQSIEANGGHIFKTIGDGFCAAFATASESVAAALTAHLAIQAEHWDPALPIQIRMALHTGSAEERGGDYFGQTLNRAARLLAIAHSGQSLLSDVTQGLTLDMLPPGVSLLDLGEHRLKDLGRPEQVFQLRHPALPATFPPLRSLNSPDLPNNLPQQVTSFIGREREITEITVLLKSTRLLTLTGSGGSGKTRLSLQVAADLLTGDSDGVWLVELAPLADPALVPQAIADVLGVREEPGKPISGMLADSLKQKSLLLVLDNCEHLISACAVLAADLLRNCPGVSILASSREPLGVSGEQIYRVPSLSLPDPQKLQTVESVSQYEAVRLFIERAKLVQPAFSVTNSNAPAVAQVCFHLDGIPLAIELAAARVRLLTVEEINARLDDRFRLLTGGSRTALPRQQTLRALIDWSYDLLAEQEQTLLSRLSVFAGGWTLEAAEAVCTGEGVADWEVLDLLTGLVDKSLVVYEETHGGRYRLLETVRRYGADRLAEIGGELSVRGRHTAWFLALAAQAEAQLRGPDQREWLARLETEHDNLRTVLTWCEQQPEERESGLRLAGALWRFWQVHGHLSEGRQWLGKVLEWSAGWGTLGSAALSARAKSLNGAGVLASDQSEYAAARALFAESLMLYRRLGDRQAIAIALNALGIMADYQGEQAAARELYEESLALRRELGDQKGLADSLNNLGGLTYEQGGYAAAQALFEESLTLYRQLGDQKGIAYALESLGSVMSDQGDYNSAWVFLEESLSLRRQLDDSHGVAFSFVSLGHVALAQGDYAAAQAMLKESLMLFRQLGDQRGIAFSLEGIGAAVWGQNQSRRAVQLLGAAEGVREEIGSPLPAIEREKVDKCLSAARTSMGDFAFAAAWAEGRKMNWEQAVEYALAQE